MAEQSIPYIKSRFETGDRPTGQDFADLVDTLKNDKALGSYGNNEAEITGIEVSTIIDSFDATEWRMVKYFVSISKTIDNNNKFYSTEFNILIDGEGISSSQFGIIDNDGDMGTVDVSRTGNTVNLTIIPNPQITPVTVRFGRMGLKA